jgi:hypothetical protein
VYELRNSDLLLFGSSPDELQRIDDLPLAGDGQILLVYLKDEFGNGAGGGIAGNGWFLHFGF